MIEELPAFDTTMKPPIHITLVLLFTFSVALSAADKAQRPNVLISYSELWTATQSNIGFLILNQITDKEI